MGPLFRLRSAGWARRRRDHAVRPSRLRSSTASRTARLALRASALAAMQVPFETGDRGAGSPGPARPGAAPTRSPAATPRPGGPSRPRRRGRCLTASRDGRCPPKDPPRGRGRPRVGSSHRERPPSRRGLTVPRPSAPVLAGEHSTVMRLHVADDSQAAAVPDAVQGPVEHRQPPLVREGLGDVRSASRIRRWSC